MELMAYRAYRNPELEIRFWRTSNRQEVDFLLNDREIAIEVKSSKRTDLIDCKHLSTLTEDGPVKHRILVSFDEEPKTLRDAHGVIRVIPWRLFFKQLWGNEYFH